MSTKIPEVPGLPLVGNAFDLDPSTPLVSQLRMCEKYGPIFRIRLPGRQPVVLVASAELAREVLNEQLFNKQPHNGALEEVKNGIGDGLFTAEPGDEAWGIAHRVLAPKFGPLGVRAMFDEIYEIATQLVLSWARKGPNEKLMVTQDFTNLTFDSIGLCAADVRFNSFYRTEPHPFLPAMAYFLRESGARYSRSKFLTNYVYRQSAQKYQESIETMKNVCDQVIQERRRAGPGRKDDVVDAMLFGKDPRTGKSMSDGNIANNMITLIIAGHETTSGLLSFLFMLFLENPAAMLKAQREVDTVLGGGRLTSELTSKMPYITACLMEALRLYPPAPHFGVGPVSTDPQNFPILIGKEHYEINQDDRIQIMLPVIHRDPQVYGEDAREFKPERMVGEKFGSYPSYAWKPFGNGSRACIGRAFAILEAHVAVILLLQSFTFRPHDTDYKLVINQTLTIKPRDFYMYATLRDGLQPRKLEERLWGGDAPSAKPPPATQGVAPKSTVTGPSQGSLIIAYGSNAGTCEALAQSLGRNATAKNFDVEVMTMDAAVERLKKVKEAMLLAVTSSYEGEPPDNATAFVAWLRQLEKGSLPGFRHAVFGCGSHEWHDTFLQVPHLVHDLLVGLGSQQISEAGYTDVTNNNILNDFDSWMDEKLWPALVKREGAERAGGDDFHGLDIEIKASSRVAQLKQLTKEGRVVATNDLVGAGLPMKRHIEIDLPFDMAYQPGDYLAVLPLNSSDLVRRIMAHFSIPWDAAIIVKDKQTHLPSDHELSVFELLCSYVELSQPASAKHMHALASACHNDEERKSLSALSAQEITESYLSVFDVITRYSSIELPFGAYLAMLPPMRVRQYSISSSPLHDASRASLTYGLFERQGKSPGAPMFRGACSHYLAGLRPNDLVQVAVRKSAQAFHPPLDCEKVPLIMACAGTGLAPFRGFVQHRAEQIKSGRKVAKALLFVGCFTEADVLYAEDFAAWQAAGAVDVRYAFSAQRDKSEGCKFVQERMWREREDLRTLYRQGAQIFVCGARRVGDGITETLLKTYMEVEEPEGRKRTEEEAQRWLSSIRNVRFAADVFD